MSTVSPPNSDSAASNGMGSNRYSPLTFLNSKDLWRPSAPSEVRDAWKKDDHAAAWKAWAKHLAAKKPASKAGKKGSPLLWGLRPAVGEALTDWLAAGPMAKNATAAAHVWVADAADREADLVFALECVAWATRLPQLAESLGADAWWSLAEALARVAEEAAAATEPDPAECEATVVEQLLAGELPLLLSRLLPELKPLHALAEPSRRALSDGLERLTDGEGLLTGALWVDETTPAASLLTACWTRCVQLTDEGKAPWSGDAQSQFEWLVRQTLRLSDRHGRVAFASADTFGAGEMLHEAVRLAGDASDEAAAGERLKGFRGDDSYDTPDPSNHSEWAELGVLSAGWRDKAPRIVVAHPADTMHIEVYAGKQVLVSGEWPVDVTLNGQALQSTDDWDCQCWHSDEDGDYLELALDLTGGARLERQFFLSREDGVAFVAETLFSEQTDSAPITVTTRLPLGEGVGLRPEKETREAFLTSGGEPAAGLVPLALPEWRDDRRGGELTAEDKQIVLSREWTGRNAASPLWFDFSPARFAKQRTWRQLHVAEALKNVSADVAVAYRVQAAKQQWLFYRSLDEPGNRTFLGQNYSSEMVIGRFKAPAGEIDEYLEIEGEED